MPQPSRGIFDPAEPPRRGGTGNVIAAIASAIIPGLGQLAQGRIGPAIFFFIVDLILWLVLSVICLGWLAILIHVWACLDAALWEPTP